MRENEQFQVKKILLVKKEILDLQKMANLGAHTPPCKKSSNAMTRWLVIMTNKKGGNRACLSLSGVCFIYSLHIVIILYYLFFIFMT